MQWVFDCDANRCRLVPMIRFLLILLFAMPTFGFARAQSVERVELELVLALDTSTSVDSEEFELQRTGLARAFRQKNIQSAIASLGPSGMAVAVVQWAGPGSQTLAVEWSKINSPNTANLFAAKLQTMPRALSGFTDISGALDFSTKQIFANAFRGARLAIDVSGDGTSDQHDPTAARDRALALGIIVNGLVVFNEEYDLGILASLDLTRHYENSVIGGPGHFLMTAESFDDFAVSIEKKLLREIIGPAFVHNRFGPTLRQ